MKGARVTASFIDCSHQGAIRLAQCAPELRRDIVVHHGDPTAELVIERARGAAVLLDGDSVIDAPTIRTLASDLRSIVFLGTGAGSYIDLETAAECGIPVRVVHGYGDRTIAEHTFALLLAASRRIAITDRAIRAGGWPREQGIELDGKTLGVIGLGGVGRHVASMARAFGLRVIAWNRRHRDPPSGVELAPLDAVVAQSDVITLHVALTDETRHLFDHHRIAQMRPGAILINTARGALVEESALVDALRDQRIGHAALDVYHDEPLPAGSALRGLENVTLTSHIAWDSPAASARLFESALGKVQRDLARLRAGEDLIDDHNATRGKIDPD
ncbi:MAG: NAD(P)-dependent oxidoreductase [Pseudomonadota bacterium]